MDDSQCLHRAGLVSQVAACGCNGPLSASQRKQHSLTLAAHAGEQHSQPQALVAYSLTTGTEQNTLADAGPDEVNSPPEGGLDAFAAALAAARAAHQVADTPGAADEAPLQPPRLATIPEGAALHHKPGLSSMVRACGLRRLGHCTSACRGARCCWTQRACVRALQQVYFGGALRECDAGLGSPAGTPCPRRSCGKGTPWRCGPSSRKRLRNEAGVAGPELPQRSTLDFGPRSPGAQTAECTCCGSSS